MRRFFCAPKTYVKTNGYENIYNFTLKNVVYLNIWMCIYLQGVGEPPLLLSSSVLFAIKDAVKAARAQIDMTGNFTLDSPATVQRIKTACGNQLKMKT